MCQQACLHYLATCWKVKKKNEMARWELLMFLTHVRYWQETTRLHPHSVVAYCLISTKTKFLLIKCWKYCSIYSEREILCSPTKSPKVVSHLNYSSALECWREKWLMDEMYLNIILGLGFGLWDFIWSLFHCSFWKALNRACMLGYGKHIFLHLE